MILALPETRQVLRLKKVAKEDPAVDANENFLMLKSVVRYIRRISALFHQDFVTSPRLVILLSLKDMDAFNKQLNQYRPGEIQLTQSVLMNCFSLSLFTTFS